MHIHTDNVFTDLMVGGSAAQKAKVSQIESYTMAEHTCNTSVNTLTHSPRWGMQGSLASSMCALSIFLEGRGAYSRVRTSSDTYSSKGML